MRIRYERPNSHLYNIHIMMVKIYKYFYIVEANFMMWSRLKAMGLHGEIIEGLAATFGCRVWLYTL